MKNTVSNTMPMESQPLRKFMKWGEEYLDHTVINSVEEEVVEVDGVLTLMTTQKQITLRPIHIQ